MSGTETKKPLVASAIKRAVLYFLGLDLLALFYYVVGNKQEFLAETQIMLLRIVAVLSSAAFLAALGGLVLSIRLWVKRTCAFSVWALAGWTISMAASGALAFLASTVRAFAGGL